MRKSKRLNNIDSTQSETINHSLLLTSGNKEIKNLLTIGGSSGRKNSKCSTDPPWNLSVKNKCSTDQPFNLEVEFDNEKNV